MNCNLQIDNTPISTYTEAGEMQHKHIDHIQHCIRRISILFEILNVDHCLQVTIPYVHVPSLVNTLSILPLNTFSGLCRERYMWLIVSMKMMVCVSRVANLHTNRVKIKIASENLD